METKTSMNLLLGALIGLSTLSGCATANRADHAPSVQDASAFDALAAAHDAAWNAHDPEQLAALFTADGTLVTPLGTRVEGRDALREMFASPGPTKQTSSRVEIEAVQWLGKDLAVLDAHQTLEGPGVAQLGASEARLTAVVERVDGAWRFVAARPYVPATRKAVSP